MAEEGFQGVQEAEEAQGESLHELLLGAVDERAYARSGNDEAALLATTREERTALAVICSMPTLSMIVLMAVGHQTILAMFVFHWICAVALPLVYMRTFDEGGWDGVVLFVKRELAGEAVHSRRIAATAFVLILSVGSGVLSLAATQADIENMALKPIVDRLSEYHLEFTVFGLTAVGLYFTFLNSFIEELFWRGFLLERLGTASRGLAISSVTYSLYHFVVIRCLLPETWGGISWLLAVFATVGICMLGLLLAIMHERKGFWVAYAVHAAVDGVVVIVGAVVLSYNSIL